MSAPAATPPSTPPSEGDSRSWTVKLRRRAVAELPPEKLLPDGQPTYVASWIYVFGVASIASLIVIIASGCILALKGPAWWHFTSVGHFFNSIHLWSVELFFFVMVVHLWGKYWMAAWRGGRARVWVTGAIVFLVAVPAALTGYVSQQNFDAQWISTQAKDALNSVGVGAFFNVTNFGQMYSYHVLLLPVALVVLVSAHVLLVRRHGVVPPIELERKLPAGRRRRLPSGRARPRRALAGAGRMSLLRRRDDTKPWTGGYYPYDLVKELCIAVGVIGLLAVLLTVLFSSPDDKPSTIGQWSHELPADFATTAAKELAGTSDTAEYGPPYNHESGSVQHFLFLHPQRWLGVSHPINTADDYVIKPLETIPGDPALHSALAQYKAAPEKQKKEWSEAYAKPLEEYSAAHGRKEDAAADRDRRYRHRHGDGQDDQQRRPRADDDGRASRASPRAADWKAASCRAGSSSRPTTPSRCCSWPTVGCSPNAPKPSTCSATSGG